MQSPRRIMWNGTVRALPLQEQLKAAKIARCEILTVTPSDYNKWLGSSISTRDMRAMAADAGIRLAHLDPFVRWMGDWRPEIPGEGFPADIIGFDQDDFFRMASALEVESFTAWGGFRTGRYSTGELIEGFGKLCQRAEQEGLRCDLEFIPVFGVPNLAKAWDMVRGAGSDNCGIVFDFWHYMRSGREDGPVASIPGEKITVVQLCDATAAVPEGMSLAEDGLNNRLAPGDGDFPIEEILAVLRSIGGLNNVGLEVFSPRFDKMTAEQIGGLSGSILDKLLSGTETSP